MNNRPDFAEHYTPEQAESSSGLRPMNVPERGNNFIDATVDDLTVIPGSNRELSVTTDRFQRDIKLGVYGDILGFTIGVERSHDEALKDAA
jgi:hypothetical protein